jgi:hypothetical protein
MEKKFVITEVEKQQIWNLIIQRQSMMVNRLLDDLPEYKEEEKEIGKIEQELRLVYEFLGGYPEILENVAKYILLNLEEKKDDQEIQKG